MIQSCLRLLFILNWIDSGICQNSPPVLVVQPRKWQIPVDSPVGTLIARVKVTDHDGDQTTFQIEPSGQQALPGLPFHDGSKYFLIQRSPNGNGLVRLRKPLGEKFKAGDKLTLSITGMDGISEITTRTEVFVEVEEGILHGDNFTTTKPPEEPPCLNGRECPGETSNPTSESPKPPPIATKEPNEMTPKKTVLGTGVIIVIVFICVFLLPIGFASWYWRERLKSKYHKYCNCYQFGADKDGAEVEDANREFSTELQIKIPNNSGNGNVYDIQNTDWVGDSRKWEIPRSQIRILDRIGEGCFGTVWRGEVDGLPEEDSTTRVAIKTTKTNATDKDKKDLLNELSVMKILEPHSNVVRLLGCCTEKDPIYVIMEYINGSTLQEFLRKSRSEHHYKNLHGASQSLSSRDLTSFAYQIAKGMEYLSSKKLIHRDLAARNVLIDSSDQCCKVADFGFARDIMANNIYERKSEGKLPIRWMAPESLYDNVYSIKSDIWSFGVLMWEVVTLGSVPYPGLHPSDVMKKVRDGYRLEKPEHCKRELYNIMVKCWEKSPETRPTFSDLVRDFETLLVKEMDYIDLNMFEHEGDYYNEAISLSGERV